jgi:hypothetical protein
MIFIRPPATPWLATFQRRFATKRPIRGGDILSLMPFIGEPRNKDFYEAGETCKPGFIFAAAS